VLPASTLLSCLLSFVRVEGSTTCPAATDVEAKLKVLLPDGGDPDNLHRVRIESSGNVVRMELRDAAGSLLGERSLEAGADCAVRASAVATIIAAWEAELQAALSVGPAPTAITLPTVQAKRLLAFQVSAEAIFGADAALGFAVGGGLSAALGPAESPFSGVVSIFTLTPRDLPLGPGTARWSRITALLGARLRLPLGPVDLDVDLDAAGCRFSAEGVGYSTNLGQWGFDAGFGASVKAGRRVGWGRVWLGASATVWPVAPVIRVAGLSETQQLPVFESYGAIGLSFESP
jgi:hypothetical protein